jgi:hypothetical protein
VKKTRKNKKLEPRSDSFGSEKARGSEGASDEASDFIHRLRLPVFLSRLVWRRKIEHFALPARSRARDNAAV